MPASMAATGGEVRVAWLGRDHVAHHDMADVARFRTAACERLAHRGGCKLRQRHVLQRAAKGADGGARCTYDVDLLNSHGLLR